MATMYRFFVSVFDSALGAYAPPVLVPSKGIAVRSFSDEVNRKDPNNALNAHPEDFELRLLALFDEVAGVFHASPEGIETLARGKDVHRAE